MLSDANIACSSITSIEMIEYDYSLANFPIADIAVEMNINNGECKAEAVAKWDLNTNVMTFIKIVTGYPPFKKLAELPQ